ncbi:hypothetical protein [Porticoccus sp.]
MKKNPLTALAFTLFISTIGLSVPSQSQAELSPEDQAAATIIGGVLFDEAEKRLLGDYLRDSRYREDDGDYGKKHKEKKLPPGLRMKLERGGELPPGWQRKVARGEVLDADIYNHSYSLPDDIRRRLPRDIDGTSLRRIDDRVVRVMDATRTVLDVFYLTQGQY